MVDERDTSTVPHNSPKNAPPARVITVAPGSDSAVTATYTAKKINAASSMFSSR